MRRPWHDPPHDKRQVGSYLEAFMIAGLLCIGAALAVLFIGAGRRGHEPVAVPVR